MFKDKYDNIIKTLTSKNSDIAQWSIPCTGGSVTMLFISQLTDRVGMSEYIVKPLVTYCAKNNESITAQKTKDSIIFAPNCTINDDETIIEDLILKGFCILLFSNDRHYLVINYKQTEKRTVTTPEVSYTLRGPKDCFIESLDSNLSLLRSRVRDKKLRIEFIEVGVRTKTRVAVVYIEDIANDTAIQEIKKRINNINTDAIYESGELQNYLLNKKSNLFPQMGLIERSDLAGEELLEGRVVVLVDGSCYALSAPKVLSEYLYSCDDRYQNQYAGLLMRILRYTALFLSGSISAVYIAIVSFHPDVLPSDYIVALAQMRARVPFNAMTEAYLMEMISELIHESTLRAPSKIGSAIGIVGTIIIGSAAVAAGIFSSPILIIVSLSLLASYAIPDNSIVSPLKICKFFLMFAASILGFYGIVLGVTVIFLNLVSINSFGVPYFAPFAPFNRYDARRAIMYNKTISPERINYLRTKDKKRNNDEPTILDKPGESIEQKRTRERKPRKR